MVKFMLIVEFSKFAPEKRLAIPPAFNDFCEVVAFTTKLTEESVRTVVASPELEVDAGS